MGIGPYHRDAEYFCNLYWAKIQIALGHFQEASTFIIPALALASEHGLLYRVAELSVLQALIHNGQGNSSAALDELGNALGISETCGYTRIFDDEPELEKLLRQAAEKKVRAKYVKQLLSSIHSSIKKDKDQPGLVDPLSERELEVLRMLAEGLPPAEVAKKLFLSPYTLKAHTQNIYTKLGVHSRIEAINKARGLNLL